MDFGNISNSSFSSLNSSKSLEAPNGHFYNNVLMASMFGLICVLGIIGNAVVLCTTVNKIRFRAQQTVPDIFVFSLSVVDLLFLLGMPFLIHQLVGNGSWCFGGTMCTVITALDSNSQLVSTYILTVMSLDRYLATVHPIRFNHLRTPRAAGAAVGLVWLFSLASITPVWMYAGLMPLPDGSVGCALLLPRPATDTTWFTLYQFVLAFALPLAVICGVYVRILHSMWATVAPLPQRRRRARTRKVTRLAVAICLAFFLCWAPYHTLQLVHLGVQRPTPLFVYAYNVAISLGYANSCINPFLYILLSQSFQRQLLVAVRHKHRRLRVEPATAPNPAPNPVPDRPALESLAPGRLISGCLAPERLVPEGLAPERLAPECLAPEHLAPGRLAPEGPCQPPGSRSFQDMALPVVAH
ncbi:melanin-concentrating hormone receptor 1 [Gadus morhua]|uniref:Melanin-concentrating hormone receptor 1 n=1 Tax=Gadus morhua TaxID=8049 RepID=A0A8C5BHL9_GADMO|nr:melanin-concentrating hormone receptor 1-like [Gadus morhua]